MKIRNRYQRLYNHDLYDELPLPIRIHDDIVYKCENEEEENEQNRNNIR